MAGTYQITAITPVCPPSHLSILEETEIRSPHYQPQIAKSVKAGCCTCLRRRRNQSVGGGSSRNAQMVKVAKAQMVLYLRYTWIDSLILAIFGIVILCLYWTPNNLRNAPLLPIWPGVAMDNNTTGLAGKFLDLRAPTEFQYPWQKSPLNDIVCAVIVTFVPVIVIGIFQVRVRSTWDFHAGHLGVLKAVTTTALIVSIMKHYIGGLRPHFLDVCTPNKTMVAEYIAMHYQELENHNFFNSTICTGNKKLIKIALQSFPSGHSANSFAAAVFLALYMNAKLKVIGDHCSHYWAFFITMLPMLLASILSAEMYLTHQHHLRDIFAGMTLGLVIGTLAYRSVYAAISDPRFNHIPLPPFSSKTQFSYCQHERVELPDGTGVNENVDKLVVWRWWKSERSDESKEREGIWLQNFRCSQATGCGSGLPHGPILPQSEDDILTMERVEERVRAALRTPSRSLLVTASTGQPASSGSPVACCV